ncbi:MAG: RecQ family ATP-dependent DNA helicase, partial [Chloroflexota bacterium]
RLIYAAPERLRQYPFVAAMAQAGLGLLVVDEAHCVTMWGNDFRPDYLFIRRVLDDLAATGHSPTLLAVTATATPAIATEIAAQLGRPLATVRGTMLRSNLHYRVINAPKSERESQLVVLCQELEGSGIVYVRSRQNAERLAGLLQRVGISAGYYHAGLSNPARKRTQDEWNTGWMRIVVATVAFGMGIDKPDVRFIIHYNLPDSVENYVQESGRAGRDGLPSQCVLFYAGSEKGSLTRFRQEDEVDLEMLRAIFTAVKKALGRRTQGVVGQESLWLALNPGGTEYGAEKVSETQLRVGLSLLERAGLLTRHYDLPLTAEITLREEHPTGPLAQLVQAIEISPGEWLDFNLSAAAITLNCPLTDLEPMLLDWAKAGAISYQPGQREMLLELAPISKDSGTPERVNKLLEELSNAHLRRVEQIADYAKSLRCRHAFLARHFGERLPSGNCGACDMCEEAAGEVKTVQTPEIAKVANSSATYPLIYYTLTALANLKAGQSIGKKGIRFIVGGHESGPQGEKNNPAWGTLPGKIKRKEWDELVDQLIKEGFIGQQEVEGPYGQNYQALSLSEKGHSWLEKATPPDAPATSDVKAIGPIKSSEGYNQAVLGCLGTLDPGGKSAAKIGRSGLIRLLLGQQSVLGTTASNPYKGSLAGQLKEKEIEALIEQLVSDGYIEQEEAYLTSGRAYQALRLTADGWLIAKASTKES